MSAKEFRSSLRQRGASLFHIVVGCGIVVLVIVVIGADASTCSGECAKVPCTAEAPCLIDTDGDGVIDQCTSGTMCAPAALGTVCEDNWWPGDDCVCGTSSRTPGQCAAGCFKP